MANPALLLTGWTIGRLYVNDYAKLIRPASTGHRQEYVRVCEEYKFRYLVTTDSRVVDNDPKITLYDLGCMK